MSLCFASSFRQVNPQRKKIQIKRGRRDEKGAKEYFWEDKKSICGRTGKVFVGGQERWPHIAGGRHSLLCNNYNVYACSTITTIVQKATKPNCQAETCNHCVLDKRRWRRSDQVYKDFF